MATFSELTDDNLAQEAPIIAYQFITEVSASVAFGLAVDRDQRALDLKDRLMEALDLLKDNMPLIEVETKTGPEEQALENIRSYLTSSDAVQNLYTGFGRSETLKLYNKLQNVVVQYGMDTAQTSRIIDDIKHYRIQEIAVDEPAL